MCPRDLRLLPRQRRLPAAGRGDRGRGPGGALHPEEGRRRFPAQGGGVLPPRRRHRRRGTSPSSASTTSRFSSSNGSWRPTSASRRGASARSSWRARSGSRTSSTSTSSSGESWSIDGEISLRRASRVARGERVLPVAVRGGRDPHDGRGGGVGHGVDRLRRGQRLRAPERAATGRIRSGSSTPRFTYYPGFKVNSGEYKVMGLAPYGEPKYVQLLLDNVVDLRDDGSFTLEPAVLRLPRRAHDDQRGVRPAVRRATQGARDQPDPAGYRPRALGPGGVRRGDAPDGAHGAPSHRDEGSLPGGRRRAQLRGERAHPARGAVQAALDPARRGRRGRRARRRAAHLAPASLRRRGTPGRSDSMRGAYLGPDSRPTRSGRFSTGSAPSTAASSRTS